MIDLGYMLFELPPGILLRIRHPRYVIGGASVCFSLFAARMAAIKGYRHLAALRTLIGVTEGIGDCVIFTSECGISRMKCLDELASRCTLRWENSRLSTADVSFQLLYSG